MNDDQPMTQRPIVIALGELLWDLLPSGRQFGGAPGNFAHHAALLGGDVRMVSGVGNDELGYAAIEQLRQSKIDVEHVQISDAFPTGAVDVKLDTDGKASYFFHQNDAWDHVCWSDTLGELAEQCEAVCFGTLGQRHSDSRNMIQTFLKSTRPSTLRIFDINLRPPFFDDEMVRSSIGLTNVLKLNEEELAYLGKLEGITGTEMDLARQLIDRYQLRLLALTRGERGGLLMTDSEVSEVAPQQVTINDTVGAGDSFTAALTVGMLQGLDLDEINDKACRLAEYVCSQAGATPPVPYELRSGLQIE